MVNEAADVTDVEESRRSVKAGFPVDGVFGIAGNAFSIVSRIMEIRALPDLRRCREFLPFYPDSSSKAIICYTWLTCHAVAFWSEPGA